MPLELLDESKIKKSGVKPTKKIESDKKSEKNTKLETKIDTKRQSSVNKIGLELIKKEEIIVCERRSCGLVDNCVLCKELNKEMFNKCPNKWL